MSTNRYKPHLLILPEDGANAQVANGFVKEAAILYGVIQVLPEAGGWLVALQLFEEDHVSRMREYTKRFLVLAIDFDGEFATRIELVKGRIPDDLKNRVFVLGSAYDPETLKAELGSFEKIGSDLAQDCREQTHTTWQHQQLQHNGEEVARLAACVRSFLFA